MRVGMVGLGKLGMPVALAIRSRDIEVWGWDTDPDRHFELKIATPREMATGCDLIFVAVPTPHAPQYGGETVPPAQTKDFNYGPLRGAMAELRQHISSIGPPVVVVVSTVLPGTLDREVLPWWGDLPLVYSPAFVAMGTVTEDYLRPEMVLSGTRERHSPVGFHEFHDALGHGAPILDMDVKSAELAKVIYNSYVSAKIVIANTIMEVCHKTGADCDEVARALAHATDRVVSDRYMRGGMGDGGACHPRDGIALADLARRLDLSFDLFSALTQARTEQTRWLASLIRDEHELRGLPVLVHGTAYKSGVDLTAGSPSALLVELLRREGVEVDHHDCDECDGPPRVVFVATDHERCRRGIPPGSVVIDPWGKTPLGDDRTVINVGRHPRWGV